MNWLGPMLIGASALVILGPAAVLSPDLDAGDAMVVWAMVMSIVLIGSLLADRKKW
jgi:hypothetical protein